MAERGRKKEGKKGKRLREKKKESEIERDRRE